MVGFLRGLFERIQDGAAELGEAIQGERVGLGLDQDIRAIDLQLHQVRQEAAAMKARRIPKEDKVKQSRADIATIEAEVAALLTRRRTTQARAKAAQAIQLQAGHVLLQGECKELKAREVEFTRLIPQFEQQLRRAKHQLDMLRAASGIQRAQAAVASLQPGPEPYPESAQVSAQRARERAARGDSDKSDSAKAGARSKPRARRQPPASDVDPAIDALLARLSPHSPETVARRAARKPR